MKKYKLSKYLISKRHRFKINISNTKIKYNNYFYRLNGKPNFVLSKKNHKENFCNDEFKKSDITKQLIQAIPYNLNYYKKDRVHRRRKRKVRIKLKGMWEMIARMPICW